MFFRKHQTQEYTAISSQKTLKILFPNKVKWRDSFSDIEILAAVLPNTYALITNLKKMHAIPDPEDIGYEKGIYRLLSWLTRGTFATLAEHNAKLQFLEFISYIEATIHKLPDLIEYEHTPLERFKDYSNLKKDPVCKVLLKCITDLYSELWFYVDNENFSDLTKRLKTTCDKLNNATVTKLKDDFQTALIKRLGLHDKTLRPEIMPEEEFKLCMTLAKDAEVSLRSETEMKASVAEESEPVKVPSP